MSSDTPAPSADELAAIGERIAAFEQQLIDACRSAGRDRDEVALVAVTKNHPASYAAEAVANGLLNLGENRPQELAAKRLALAADHPAAAADAQWHFIGRLQRNKAKQVVENADVVQSVDRAALAQALAKAASAGERWRPEHPLPVLLQVDLDPDREPGELDSAAARGGAHPDDLGALADEVAASGLLQVAGVMAVAPLGHEPDACFERLRAAAERLRSQHPSALQISAGMSADFAAAIRNGATIVRVGTALFGARHLT